MRGGLLGAGQVARDLPDAYPGQVHGGLFLSLSLLAGSAGQLVERPRVRIALAVVSLLLTVMAMYVFFGAQPPDIHLPHK